MPNMIGSPIAERPPLLQEIVTQAEELQTIASRHDLDSIASRLKVEVLSLLEESELIVCLVGEFSAGKSSLLNMLLNEAVLPVGVRPTTAVAIELHQGSPSYAIRSGEGSRELTAEEFTAVARGHTPLGKGEILEVARDHVLLKQVRFVDTPGLEAFGGQIGLTYAYLPMAHVALVVLDAARGVSRTLIEFLRNAVLPAYYGKLVFALNKMDLISPAEQSAVFRQVTTVLKEVHGHQPHVITCSAEPFSPDVSALRKLIADEFLLQHWDIVRQQAEKRLSRLQEELIKTLEVNRNSLSLSDEQLQQAQGELARLVKASQRQLVWVTDYVRQRIATMCNTVPATVRHSIEAALQYWQAAPLQSRSTDLLVNWLAQDLNRLIIRLQTQMDEIADLLHTEMAKLQPLRLRISDTGELLPTLTPAHDRGEPLQWTNTTNDPVALLAESLDDVLQLKRILDRETSKNWLAWTGAIAMKCIDLLRKLYAELAADQTGPVINVLREVETDLVAQLQQQLNTVRDHFTEAVRQRYDERVNALQLALQSQTIDRDQKQREIDTDLQRLRK